MDRTELQRLAQERLADAEALFAAGRFSGAYYLAGYVIECAVKACVAKLTTPESLPDRELARILYTHDLKTLAKAEKLDVAIGQRAKSDPEFDRNWAIVNFWSEDARYKSWSRDMAKSMLDAVSDRAYGVLPCIAQYW